MRKGFGLSGSWKKLAGGYAAYLEAQPQRQLNLPDGKATAFPHISGQSPKNISRVTSVTKQNGDAS